MKTPIFCINLAVIAALFFPASLRAEQSPDKPDLLLSGLGPVSVQIVRLGCEPNISDTNMASLGKKIERKLNDADLNVIESVYIGQTNKPPGPNVSELKIEITAMRLADKQQYALHIRTSLARPMELPKRPRMPVKADVWKTDAVMRTVPASDVMTAITDIAAEQTGLFVKAYRAANPPGKKIHDTNDDNAVSEKKQQGSSKEKANKSSEGSQFIASKNGKVFHKPGCSSVNTISKENIVIYQTRDEAIKAGKRPCKKCNP